MNSGHTDRMDLFHAILYTLAVVAAVAIVGSLTADAVPRWLNAAADFIERKAHPAGRHQDIPPDEAGKQ